MKCFYLLLILMLSMIVYAQLGGVSLIYPQDGMINTTSNSITFTCVILTGVFDAVNVTLYTNISGNFAGEVTDFISPYELTRSNIPNGNYRWNCLATNSSNAHEFAASNYTFTISLSVPTTIFEGTIPNQTWPEDSVLGNAFNLSLYFKNATTYSVSGNSNIVAGIMSNGFVNFSQPGNWTGAETITFMSNGVSSNPIVLNVTNINDPPILLENIPTQTITKNVNKTLNLDNYISDVDSTLTYIYTSLQHISVYINGDNVILTPALDWIGVEYIVFTAYDAQYNTSSNNITLNVVNSTGTNHQPEILSFYPPNIPNIIVGMSQVFNVSFFDVDDDPLSVSWYLNSQLVSTDSSYTLLPQEPGPYNLTVDVSDGSLFNSVTWLFDVASSGPQNNAGQNTTSSLCGNNQTDVGENCLNCQSDVKCGNNEICESGQCISTEKSSFSSVLIYIASAIGFLLFSFALISFLEKRRKIKIDKDVIKKAKENIEDNTIESYIRKNLRYKVSESIIKEKLLDVGWSLEDINEVFEKIKNEGKPRTN